MPAVPRDGREIHFSRTGSGPGVVLVPGLGAGARQFGTLPRRFARAGFTCAAVDPVGLPPSGPLPEPYSIPAAAADVLAVAATLPAPVALVGTSLGGKVALAAGATPGAGIARLGLLCSAALSSPRARRVYRFFELLATAVDPGLLGELTAPFLFGDTFHRTHEAVVDDILRANRPTPESRVLMQQQCRALLAFDGRHLASACPFPTLCLAGAEDTFTLPSEVEATAALLPRGSYRCQPGAGHSLLLESAAAFDELVAFLRG